MHRIFLPLLTLLSALTLSAQPNAGSTPAVPSPAGPDPAIAAQDNADALRGMGYAMASQLGLNFGWSDEEVGYIMEGMRRAARGMDEFPDMQMRLQRAQLIFRQKQMAFQAEQERQRSAQSEINKAKGQEFLANLQMSEEGLQVSDSGLVYKIMDPGGPILANEEDRVRVNYTGTLIDGTVFDSTENRDPATFPVSGVVPGFSEGVQLVGEGGKVRLYIPSNLGYGDNPRPGGAIGPGDLLIFDVEMVEILKADQESSGQRTPPAGVTPPPGPPPNFTPPPPPGGLRPPPPPNSGG